MLTTCLHLKYERLLKQGVEECNTIESKLNILYRLITKKEIYVPTVFGWFTLCGTVIALSFLSLWQIYPFLAYHNPVNAEVLIIESCVPDYALKEAISEFENGSYKFFITTGGPLSKGSYLADYKTFAELTAASLKKLGVSAHQIVALPNSYVLKDRTYASALEVRKWLLKHPKFKTINLFTMGAHARRSQYLFRKSLPSKIKLGVITVTSRDYIPGKWWSSSSGVRTVISEGIAYLYFRFLWFGEQA